MDGIPPINYPNEWPQNQSNEKAAMMPQASTGRIMEKPSHEQQLQQQQQQQQPLKCPRCDSTNTKFCYYNNYSLSQPRHFCKACKRYWTRGGTLRNVPVGGGCRRNKRVKRPPSHVMDGSLPFSAASAANPIISSSVQPHMDISSSASNHVSPLLFGLPNNPSEMNLSYPRFNTKVSNMDGAMSGYDHLQPQFNALGLGFSSGIMSNAACNSYVQNGFDSSRMNQDPLNSKSLLSSYSSLFGNSHSPAITSSSLLASTLNQQKFMNGTDLKETLAPNDVQVFGSQVACTNSEAKDVKAEGQNRLEWNAPYHNQADQFGNMPDPSMYWNATSNVGTWHDPTNIGSSSVPSLI